MTLPTRHKLTTGFAILTLVVIGFTIAAPLAYADEFSALRRETGLANEDTPATSKTGSSGIWAAVGNALGTAFATIIELIADYVAGYLVNIAGWFFDQFMKFAMTDLSETSFVKVGFGITLGVANMFFVLILLWIAIATIFDFEPYTARSLLPRLIIAALLINFSLAIGNTFIKLSNGIAAVFYARLTDDGTKNIYEIIGKATKIKGATTIPEVPIVVTTGQIQSAKDVKAGVGNLIFAAIWKLIISPILIFVLLAGAIFILIRQLSLAFLLILGPIAFLFMILPATKGMWSSWWQKLFRWSFFLPAFMFFMFLSLTVGSNLLTAASTNPDDPMPIFLQYFMTVGLLVGSLIVANQMGIAGAGAVNAVGRRMASGTSKWARGKAGRVALAPAARGAAKLEASQHVAARALMAVPGMRRGAQNLAALEKKQISTFEGKLDKFSSSELKRRHEMVTTSRAEKAAIISTLSKRRDLGPDDKDGIKWDAGKHIGATIRYMDSIGEDPVSLKRAVPHLLDDTDATRKDGMTERERTIRGLRSEHIERLDPDFFDDAQSLRYASKHWGSGQFSKMMAFSPNVMAKKFQNAVTPALEGMSQAERDAASALQADLIANIRNNRSAAQYFKSSPSHGYGYSVPGISDDAPVAQTRTATPAQPQAPAVVAAPEQREPRERTRFDAEGRPITGEETTT